MAKSLDTIYDDISSLSPNLKNVQNKKILKEINFKILGNMKRVLF